MLILHAKASQQAQALSAELLKENDFLVLAGPVGAFDATALHPGPAAVPAVPDVTPELDAAVGSSSS